MNTFINIFLSPILCALIYIVRLTKEFFSISPIRIDTLDSLLSMSILSSAEKCIFQNNLVNRGEGIIYKLNIETLRRIDRNILDCSLLPSDTSITCKQTAVMFSLASRDIVMGNHSPKSAGLLDSAFNFKLDSSCLISA